MPIRYCSTCKPHEFQDKTHGHNFRVHNRRYASGSNRVIGYRCTVCGNTTKEKELSVVKKDG